MGEERRWEERRGEGTVGYGIRAGETSGVDVERG